MANWLFWVRERTKLRNRVHALLDRQNTELALPVCSDLFGVKGSRALEGLASTLAPLVRPTAEGPEVPRCGRTFL